MAAKEWIAEARAFLCVAPIGSKPDGLMKKHAKELRKALNDFNRGKADVPACPNEGSGDKG